MKALHMSDGRAKRLAESGSRGLQGPAAEAYKGWVIRATKTTCQSHKDCKVSDSHTDCVS